MIQNIDAVVVLYHGVLYIAPTFLAHHYPHIARAKELQSVKDILNNDEDTKDIVLWESSDKLDLFGENPFEFGHIIAIGKMKDTNKIGAIVSFFGRINFAVNLAKTNSILFMIMIGILFYSYHKTLENSRGNL